jgi:hypothetical protein
VLSAQRSSNGNANILQDLMMQSVELLASQTLEHVLSEFVD